MICTLLNEVAFRFNLEGTLKKFTNKEKYRVFFTIQDMHWYFIDYHKEFSNLTLIKFAKLLCENVECVKFLKGDIEDLYDEFKSCLKKIPVAGAIMIDDKLKKICMVVGVDQNKYGIPKGKICTGETDYECAEREVLEECSLKISNYSTKNAPFIQVKSNQHIFTAFIIVGIPSDFKFKPDVRREIRLVTWINLCLLPYNNDFEDGVSPQREIYKHERKTIIECTRDTELIMMKFADWRRGKNLADYVLNKNSSTEINHFNNSKMVTSPYPGIRMMYNIEEDSEYEEEMTYCKEKKSNSNNNNSNNNNNFYESIYDDNVNGNYYYFPHTVESYNNNDINNNKNKKNNNKKNKKKKRTKKTRTTNKKNKNNDNKSNIHITLNKIFKKNHLSL